MTTLREPAERIDERMLTVWRISAWPAGLVLLVGAAGCAAGAVWLDWPWWIALALAVAGLAELWLCVVILPPYWLKSWRYEIREEEIALRHGLVFKEYTVIPMVRVQHVDLKQGPVMRRYQMAAVAFSTAAGGHEIPGLALDKAEEVRDRIIQLARLAHEDI